MLAGYDSYVNIAICYELDGPGFENPWERVSPDPLKPVLKATLLPVK